MLARKVKRYHKTLTACEDTDPLSCRLDVRIETKDGEVLDFSLSLKYIHPMEKVHEVYRADTAPHRDNPHEHLFWKGGNYTQDLPGHSWKTYNKLLNEAFDKIENNFVNLTKQYKRAKGV